MGDSRKKICIIGANGQVGTEVCTFLDESGEVDVLPVCRTRYGSSVLRRLGLSCRHGDVTRDAELLKVVSQCDLVADFSLPRGSPPELISSAAARIEAIVPKLKPGAHFVFISTMAVFHLNPNNPRFQIYGYTKRHGEQAALRFGRKARRHVSVLRLGQVHGVNQSCSKALRSQVKSGIAALPPYPSHTVFCYSIAEALINLAKGVESPEVYTLTSVPAWSWREVHEFYCREAGVPVPEMWEEAAPARSRSWQPAASVKAWLGERIYAHRELLETITATLSPEWATRLRANYYRRRARAELSFLSARKAIRPYVQWCDVPGARMKMLSDSRAAMQPAYERVQRRFAALSAGHATAHPPPASEQQHANL